MYFSNREKQIIKLLVEYTAGITPQELQDLLQISKRTLYREMSSIEKSLKTFEVQLVKPRGKGYRLIGDEKQLSKLRQLVQEDQRVPLDNVQRQSALAASLLLAEEEQTVEGLALDFEVSPSTIHADLQVVEKSLQDYHLTLERRKARGILISGGEYERRQILGNLIYSGVSEYDFFHYLTQLSRQEQPRASNFFLNLITASSFYYAKQVILEKLKSLFVEVTDNQVQQVLTILALSIDRVQTGHFLTAVSDHSQSSTEISQLAQQILTAIEAEAQIRMPQEEQLFFARQLEGVNYKKPQNIFLESFDVELSYQVRELIRIVSKAIDHDFRADDTLYYDLLTHLSAAFKRMDNRVQMSINPLLEKVVDEYQLLAAAIRHALTGIFPQEHFSQDELAYLVIHFAASLERNPMKKAISTLVLCSSGIGTAKILESRIRKYIPEIDHIQIVKISQMSHLDSRNLI